MVSGTRHHGHATAGFPLASPRQGMGSGAPVVGGPKQPTGCRPRDTQRGDARGRWGGCPACRLMAASGLGHCLRWARVRCPLTLGAAAGGRLPGQRAARAFCPLP